MISFHPRDARKSSVVPNALTHPLCSPPSFIAHSGDGQFGQLGHGDGNIRSCPTLVQSLIDDPSGCGKSRNQHYSMTKAKSCDKKHEHPGQALRAVACGAFHTAIVNNDGELLTFGLGTSGQVRNGCGRMRRVRCVVGCFGNGVVLLPTASVLLPGEATHSPPHALLKSYYVRLPSWYSLHPSSCFLHRLTSPICRSPARPFLLQVGPPGGRPTEHSMPSNKPPTHNGAHASKRDEGISGILRSPPHRLYHRPRRTLHVREQR